MDEEEQHDRSDRGGDQATDQAIGTEAQESEEKAPEYGTDHPDDEIANETESAASHDLAGQPPGHNSDDQEPNETHNVHAGLLEEALFAERREGN
jgi:hypothetical protein